MDHSIHAVMHSVEKNRSLGCRRSQTVSGATPRRQ
jgi:hypothetical protein